MNAGPPFEIEFYEDVSGKKPALHWIKNDLTEYQRRVVGLAMNETLQYEGTGVCDGEWGKALGAGLYEFRVRPGPREIVSLSKPTDETLAPEQVQGRDNAARRGKE